MRVFISYRRAETQDLSGRIRDRLVAVEEIEDVFLDVNEIPVGTVFEPRVDEWIQSADVIVAVIGDRWRAPRDDGSARILEDNDLVRAEVRAALARQEEMRIVPVLVNGAKRPHPKALPQDLAALPGINATTVGHDSFERDIDALTAAVLGISDYHRDNRSPIKRAMKLVWHSFIGAAIAALGFLLLNFKAKFSCSSDSSYLQR